MAKGTSSGKAPSQRQLRVGEAIRRRLSEILQRGDTHDPELTRLSITVGEGRVSPDLRGATAFVLPLGGGNKDEALERLDVNRGEIRRLVGQGLGLKHAPEIRYLIDDTYDRMDATRAMLNDPRVRQDTDE